MVNGVATRTTHPTMGVVPGCPGACAWAKLALLEAMDGAMEDFLHLDALRLNIHVDDITVAMSSGSGRALVGGMLQVLGRLQGP